MGDVVVLREEVAPKWQVARPQEHPAHGALHRAEPAPVQKFLAGLTRYDDCGAKVLPVGIAARLGEKESPGDGRPGLSSTTWLTVRSIILLGMSSVRDNLPAHSNQLRAAAVVVSSPATPSEASPGHRSRCLR
jgi:hypothetical protein